MKNILEILIIMFAGSYVCVLRNPLIYDYSSFNSLLFFNTSDFNQYNVPAFSFTHTVWYLLFLFVMIHQSLKKLNDSKGIFEMELYRSSFKEVLLHAVRAGAENGLKFIILIFMTDILIFLAFYKTASIFSALSVSILFFIKLFEWILFFSISYFLLMFLYSSQTGLYFCNIAAAVTALIDLIAGTSFITYTDSIQSGITGMLLILLCMIVSMISAAYIFRKGKNIQ